MADKAEFYSRRDFREIDADSLIDRAIALSGLGEYLDDGLRERVRRMVGRVNARGLVTRANGVPAEFQLINTLHTRLKFAETLAKYPEIAQEKIERPIFVVGYGRTGTTIMHSLLRCDPRARAPEAWEIFYPSPPPGVSPESIPARIAAGEYEVKEYLSQIPALDFHPYWDELGHATFEDDEIFGINFHSSVMRFYLSPLAMLSGVDEEDAPLAYPFHHDFLRMLQYRRGIGHWVCKGTFHQSHLRALLDTYPDATCVWTHRNPASFVGSVLATASIFYDKLEGGCDRLALGPALVQGLAALCDGFANDPIMNDPRVIHVRFEDLMADHVGTVRRIYDSAGLDFVPEIETAIVDWLGANKPDRYGKFSYSLKDFGIDRDSLEPMFRGYVERFGLQA